MIQWSVVTTLSGQKTRVQLVARPNGVCLHPQVSGAQQRREISFTISAPPWLERPSRVSDAFKINFYFSPLVLGMWLAGVYSFEIRYEIRCDGFCSSILVFVASIVQFLSANNRTLCKQWLHGRKMWRTIIID
jgi:hypothetical protein